MKAMLQSSLGILFFVSLSFAQSRQAYQVETYNISGGHYGIKAEELIFQSNLYQQKTLFSFSTQSTFGKYVQFTQGNSTHFIYAQTAYINQFQLKNLEIRKSFFFKDIQGQFKSALIWNRNDELILVTKNQWGFAELQSRKLFYVKSVSKISETEALIHAVDDNLYVINSDFELKSFPGSDILSTQPNFRTMLKGGGGNKYFQNLVITESQGIPQGDFSILVSMDGFSNGKGTSELVSVTVRNGLVADSVTYDVAASIPYGSKNFFLSRLWPVPGSNKIVLFIIDTQTNGNVDGYFQVFSIQKSFFSVQKPALNHEFYMNFQNLGVLTRFRDYTHGFLTTYPRKDLEVLDVSSSQSFGGAILHMRDRNSYYQVHLDPQLSTPTYQRGYAASVYPPAAYAGALPGTLDVFVASDFQSYPHSVFSQSSSTGNTLGSSAVSTPVIPSVTPAPTPIPTPAPAQLEVERSEVENELINSASQIGLTLSQLQNRGFISMTNGNKRILEWVYKYMSSDQLKKFGLKIKMLSFRDYELDYETKSVANAIAAQIFPAQDFLDALMDGQKKYCERLLKP